MRRVDRLEVARLVNGGWGNVEKQFSKMKANVCENVQATILLSVWDERGGRAVRARIHCGLGWRVCSSSSSLATAGTETEKPCKDIKSATVS